MPSRELEFDTPVSVCRSSTSAARNILIKLARALHDCGYYMHVCPCMQAAVCKKMCSERGRLISRDCEVLDRDVQIIP